MRITSIILALAVVVGLAYWFGLRHDDGLETLMAAGRGGETAEVPSDPAPEIEAAPQTSTSAPAERNGPVPVTVLASAAADTAREFVLRGRTEANRFVEVKAETDGRVVSEPLRRGASVEAGAVLCRLDPGTREAQLESARAQLAEARIQSDAATRLSAQGFAAETARAQREYALEAAQAALELVELDYDRLEVRAPFSGLLESDAAEYGSLLNSGDTCATVIDLSRVKAVGFVSERMVDLLRLGQPAEVRLVNGLTRTGAISFVARMADPETRTYEVEIALANDDMRLRDGMTAEINVALPAERGHLLPESALTLDDDGRLGVRLVADGRARFAPVEILHDDPKGIWVTGLPDRAEVIVVGQEFVGDGRPVIPSRVGWDDLG